MPSTTLVVACLAVAAVLVILLLRSRKKSPEPEASRFEPPRELATRPAKKEVAKAPPEAPSIPPPLEANATGVTEDSTMRLVVPPAVMPGDEELEPTRIDAMPSSKDLAADALVDTSIDRDQKASTAATAPPPAAKPRPQLRSHSDIEDLRGDDAAAMPTPVPPQPEPPPASEPKAPTPVASVSTSEPALKQEPRRTASEPRLAPPPPKLPSTPKLAAPKLPVSEPKIAAPKLPVSEPRVPPAKPVSVPAEAKPAARALPASEPNIAVAAKPEADFSGVNDVAPARPAAAAAAAAATAAKFLPPSNPATAELEKNDPRHAAARRLARLSVSEIKLYHEDEVKTGREAKDLWKRLQTDIGLARQTFDQRVAADVRERFDYLLDEVVRQLAEGDPAKLGPEAPTPKSGAAAAPAAEPAAPATVESIPDEAPTKTAAKVVPPAEPAKPAPAPAPVPAAVAAPAPAPVAAAKPVAGAAEPAAKPTGLAARAIATNPETAELEKNDPRHAAARRLARLSVSEIKLYHEDEVKAGRLAKDLWTRMITDIGLASQTYDKRVDKDVRDRFDYLYDEILRQLAEGDPEKLGPAAPKPKASTEVAAAPAPVAAAPAPVAAAPAPAPAAPAPAAPAPAPVAAAPAPAPAAPTLVAAAPAPAAVPSAAARYLPPSNPATAELEKNDPRHAAARRLARLSVSEIKLYHEDEVKAGREAKDIWKRLITDIGLATQTYEKRVDKEVRDRFDYLFDEILRQLAEGDLAKLGPDAPKQKESA